MIIPFSATSALLALLSCLSLILLSFWSFCSLLEIIMAKKGYNDYNICSSITPLEVEKEAIDNNIHLAPVDSK